MAADVCVVGLGGSGLSAIEELLRLKLRVVGVDARDVGGGAAGRNGGFLLAGAADFHHDAVAAWGRERAVAIHERTSALLAEVYADAAWGARCTGSLRIASDAAEREDCRAQFEAMRQDGLAVERYLGPEGSGLLFPDDGVFQPLARCRAVAARAMMRGAVLHATTPVTGFEHGRVVTARGEVRAPVTIVAVDGGLSRLVPELASRVSTVRLQMLATAPTTDVAFPRPVYYRYGYEYWQQLPDGCIALGGMRDRGGEAEWTEESAPSEPVQELLDAHLREVVGTQAPVTHRWAASVGYTEDGLPVAEEVRPGIWALGGYSGTGNLVGAILGRAVARAATGHEASDLAIFT